MSPPTRQPWQGGIPAAEDLATWTCSVCGEVHPWDHEGMFCGVHGDGVLRALRAEVHLPVPHSEKAVKDLKRYITDRDRQDAAYRRHAEREARREVARERARVAARVRRNGAFRLSTSPPTSRGTAIRSLRLRRIEGCG